jgi:hypothetical protein
MRSTLEAVLPSIEACARGAKSAPAKKQLMTQIAQINRTECSGTSSGVTSIKRAGELIPEDLAGVHTGLPSAGCGWRCTGARLATWRSTPI